MSGPREGGGGERNNFLEALHHLAGWAARPVCFPQEVVCFPPYPLTRKVVRLVRGLGGVRGFRVGEI